MLNTQPHNFHSIHLLHLNNIRLPHLKMRNGRDFPLWRIGTESRVETFQYIHISLWSHHNPESHTRDPHTQAFCVSAKIAAHFDACQYPDPLRLDFDVSHVWLMLLRCAKCRVSLLRVFGRCLFWGFHGWRRRVNERVRGHCF